MSYTGQSSSDSASSQATSSPARSSSSSSTASSIQSTWWTGQGFAEEFRERDLPYSRSKRSDTDTTLDATEYTFTVGEQPDKDMGDTLVGEYHFKIYFTQCYPCHFRLNSF